jgi:hypothetical protein
MRTFNLLCGASVAALASVVSLGAAKATTFDWDWSTSDNSNTTQVAGNQLSVASNGQTLTAESYQLIGNVGSNGSFLTGSKYTDTLSTARLFSFGSGIGLGVTNSVEAGNVSPTTAVGPAPSPEHTVSNQATTSVGGVTTQVTDLIAFQLPTISGSTLSISSLSLTRWGGSSGSANTSVLIGKANGLSISTLAGQSIKSLESAGFQLLQFGGTSTNNNGPSPLTISSTAVDTNTAAEGDQGGTLGGLTDVSGDILIIAASLDDNGSSPSQTDFIKPLSIVTTSTKVPEPGTLAMFGVGLAGLIGLRRRRKKAE